MRDFLFGVVFVGQGRNRALPLSRASVMAAVLVRCGSVLALGSHIALAGLAGGQCRESIKVTDRLQETQEHVMRRLRRKRCREDVTKDDSSADVEPIFAAQATCSVNEVVELRL